MFFFETCNIAPAILSLGFRCMCLSVFPRVAWLDMIIISDTAGSDVALTTASSSLISIYLESYCASHRTVAVSTLWLTDAYMARTRTKFSHFRHYEISIGKYLNVQSVLSNYKRWRDILSSPFFCDVYVEIVVAALECGWINRWPVQYVARISRSIYRVYAV